MRNRRSRQERVRGRDLRKCGARCNGVALSEGNWEGRRLPACTLRIPLRAEQVMASPSPSERGSGRIDAEPNPSVVDEESARVWESGGEGRGRGEGTRCGWGVV